jgi:hypothetical protein
VREESPSVFEEALLCHLESWEEWVEKMIDHNAQYLDWRLRRLKIDQEIEEAMEEFEDKIQEIKEAMEEIEDKDQAPGPETDGEGDEKAQTLPN